MDNQWDVQQFYKDRNIMSAPALGCSNEHQTIGCCDSLVYPPSNTWKYMRAGYRQKVLEARQRSTASASRKDYYDTIDEAAIDFVLQYGKDSITSWCEYDAVINTFDVDGITMYKWEEYGIGEKKVDEYGNPTGNGEGAELQFELNSVAYVHTHSLYIKSYNDEFSDTDKKIARDCSVFAYVGIPSGEVRRYNPWNGEDVSIYNKAPFDTNHPKWKVD